MRVMVTKITCNFNCLLVAKLVQANNREISELCLTWPLSFVRGNHQQMMDSPHKRPVMQNAFPCHSIILDHDIDSIVPNSPRQQLTVIYMNWTETNDPHLYKWHHNTYLMADASRSNPGSLNTLRPRQNGRHFPDDNFKYIFFNENVWSSIKISLKFVRKGPINNIPALVQIMAWRRPGDKPLSGPMMVSLPTHICVTRPQWVKHVTPGTHFTDAILRLWRELHYSEK